MGRVLIVEDNDLNMKLFHDLLTIQKHQVFISRDGASVMDIALSQNLDLILMDIQLNGISGIDLIYNLKATPNTSSIPIIAITAFAMKKDEIRISQSGCDMYLAKPVSIDSFFKAVEKFVKPVKENVI